MYSHRERERDRETESKRLFFKQIDEKKTIYYISTPHARMRPEKRLRVYIRLCPRHRRRSGRIVFSPVNNYRAICSPRRGSEEFDRNPRQSSLASKLGRVRVGRFEQCQQAAPRAVIACRLQIQSRRGRESRSTAS